MQRIAGENLVKRRSGHHLVSFPKERITDPWKPTLRLRGRPQLRRKAACRTMSSRRVPNLSHGYGKGVLSCCALTRRRGKVERRIHLSIRCHRLVGEEGLRVERIGCRLVAWCAKGNCHLPSLREPDHTTEGGIHDGFNGRNVGCMKDDLLVFFFAGSGNSR